jgi:hypothetical protein
VPTISGHPIANWAQSPPSPLMRGVVTSESKWFKGESLNFLAISLFLQHKKPGQKTKEKDFLSF